MGLFDSTTNTGVPNTPNGASNPYQGQNQDAYNQFSTNYASMGNSNGPSVGALGPSYQDWTNAGSPADYQGYVNATTSPADGTLKNDIVQEGPTMRFGDDYRQFDLSNAGDASMYKYLQANPNKTPGDYLALGQTTPTNTFGGASLQPYGPPMQYLSNPTGDMQPIGMTSSPQNNMMMNGLASQSFNGVPNTQAPTTGQTTPTNNMYGTNPFMGSTSPYIQAAQQTNQGNINAANTATAANRVNQNTPYGSLQYSQTGTDANGNPIWTANQTLSQPLQDLTNTSLSNLQSSLQNPMYGINPGQTYSDAIMSRLQPQIAHQNEMSDQALANQGIMPGSQAYENAKRVLGQQQNDLQTSAIINGMNTGLQAQNLQNTTAANVKALGTPTYVNPYNQAAVAAPDYLGAYSTQNAADIAKSNAQMAQQTAQMNGLLGLGSSALLGGTGTGSVLGSLGTGLGNLGTMAQQYYNSLNPAITSGQTAANLSQYGLSPSDFTNPLSTDTSALSAASQYF